MTTAKMRFGSPRPTLISTKDKGFTVIELVTILASIGVLAGIGIPQFSRYVRMSKTTEAVTLMAEIARAQGAWAIKQRSLTRRDGSRGHQLTGPGCDDTVGPTCHSFVYSRAYDNSRGMLMPPAGGKKVKLWQDPEPGSATDLLPFNPLRSFATLGVDFSQPMAFAFFTRYDAAEVVPLAYSNSASNTFFVEAYGDLDGDGVLSTFRRVGYVDKNADIVNVGGIYSVDAIE